MDEYLYSYDEENFIDYCAVMDFLREQYKEGAKVTIWKGKKATHTHDDFLHIDNVADGIVSVMVDSAYQQLHESLAENYLNDVSYEDCKRLRDHILEWFMKNAKCELGKVVDIVEFEVTVE